MLPPTNGRARHRWRPPPPTHPRTLFITLRESHRLTLSAHAAGHWPAPGRAIGARVLDTDLEAVDEADRSTPLGLAAREGHIALVEALLERGANPHGAGASWATPLAWAERRGHRAIVTLLQSLGA